MKRTLLSVAAAAALVSACSQTSEPTVQSTATTDATALWDPCTLPDDVIADADLLPETKNVGRLFEDWEMCTWKGQGKWYSVGIYANREDLDAHFANSVKSNFQKVTVGGKDAWTYQQGELPLGQECALVLPTTFGSIDFRASKYSSTQHSEAAPCELVLSVVERLLPSIPT